MNRCYCCERPEGEAPKLGKDGNGSWVCEECFEECTRCLRGERAMWGRVENILTWLNEHAIPSADPRVMYVFKVVEEMGEAAQAIIGATGQNPRKGVTHTWEDVKTEVCDIILSGMVALQSIAGEDAEEVFAEHAKARLERLLATEAQ